MKFAVALVFLFCAFSSARFVDVTANAGIDYIQQPPYENRDLDCLMKPCYLQDTTGGAAVADFDGDGWPDIYVTRLFDRNEDGVLFTVPDILYRNQGDGTFVDVTEQVGLGDFRWFSISPLFCDVDNDGDLDLYVSTMCPVKFMDDEKNRNYLFLYEDGKYTEAAEDWDVDIGDGNARIGRSSVCGDFDRDGYMDMFVSQWTPRPDDEDPFEVDYVQHTSLFWNDEATGFRNIIHDTDVFVDILEREHNFAGEFVDFDKDGHPDLLVSADFHKSQYYKNMGDGTFMRFTEESNCCGGSNDMGTAFGDINNDGQLDWFLTSMGLNAAETDDPSKVCEPGDEVCGNRLYIGNGDTMLDRTTMAGVRRGGWGWGAAFFDIENDGDLDLAMTNGHYSLPLTGSNGFLWENIIGFSSGLRDSTDDLNFVDKYGFGLALITLDYDMDGDLDVFISHAGDGGTLLRNDANDDYDYVKIKTIGMGAPQGTNYFGKGCQITIMNQGVIHYQEMGVGSPLLGHSDNTVAHFGLGHCIDGKFDSISVWFPVSDTTYYEENVSCNKMHEITEKMAMESSSSSQSRESDSSSDGSSSSSNSASWVVPSMILVALCVLF